MPLESSRHPRSPETRLPTHDLSTIHGIAVDSVELPDDAEAMAVSYCDELVKQGPAAIAEVAWAFRRQLQEDLRRVGPKTGDTTLPDEQAEGLGKRLRTKLIREDESHALSFAIYRRLLKLSRGKLAQELTRHEQEKKAINGTYEEFKGVEKKLEEERTKLNTLLAEMFKRAGQEPKPVHIAKRAVLESRITDLQTQLDAHKNKASNVAALIEYDTIREYAKQLRTTGFVWTKSRYKLLRDVLTGALTSRPVAALMGETGTGKTAMARAASLELASREPERTVGGDQEKFVRLLASPAISSEKGTSYDFGPLLRAMTGLSSSTDNPTNTKGGGIFFDDEFNTRPTSVQRQILKFVSEARPGRKITVPGTPLTVTIQPGFLYLAAGNPPSERYDREETGIETKREFAGNVLNVEYLEQTKENPELFQVLLAGFLDEQTGRLTAIGKDEVAPNWITDKTTKESTLDEDPSSGAFLWRFSQAWGELFKAFSKHDTILHKKNPTAQKKEYFLKTFILDPGVVLSWIDQYKADPSARKKHMADYFNTKLTTYISQFPQDEQTLVYKYFNLFGIPKTKKNTEGKDVPAEVTKPKLTTLTPQDMGYLNPNVPRPKVTTKPAPATFEGQDVIDPETGDPTGVTELPPDPEPAPQTPEKPFVYDKEKAKEYGFTKLTIEGHPKADELLRLIYGCQPPFVTTNPDGTVTVDMDAIKLYWQQHCQDLPNIPEKSDWFFKAIADNRLSNTIDSDDATKIGQPSNAHVPAFDKPEFLLAMDFHEFDYDNAAEKQANITPQTKAILKKLFNQENPTSLKRDDINTALWEDHEQRIHSPKALQIIRELLGPTANPNDYELRLLRFDEYARAAKISGYGQKNLWTHFDGYYQHGDGHCAGLDGGIRDSGGAAHADYDPRDNRSECLSVRLVLSRK